MKTINRFITERLKINKDSKVVKYNYFPESWSELRVLLSQLMKERGPNADLNDIDVSKVDTFYYSWQKIGLFENLNPRNINISKWNVSNIDDMSYMFRDCRYFNCNLSKWNVSRVENMHGMFDECENFTGEGLERWNVSNVEDMGFMFFGCKKFTGKALENWKVIKLKDMNHMFRKCTSLNCNLSKWDVSSVKIMQYAFDDCPSLKNKPSWYIYK